MVKGNWDSVGDGAIVGGGLASSGHRSGNQLKWSFGIGEGRPNDGQTGGGRGSCGEWVRTPVSPEPPTREAVGIWGSKGLDR